MLHIIWNLFLKGGEGSIPVPIPKFCITNTRKGQNHIIRLFTHSIVEGLSKMRTILKLQVVGIGMGLEISVGTDSKSTALRC